MQPFKPLCSNGFIFNIFQEPTPTSSKKTVPAASPKSSSPEKNSSSTATTLAPVAPSSGAKDIIPREETTSSPSKKIAAPETTAKVKELVQTPAPAKKILTPVPASQPPSASKPPLSTSSKVINDTIVIPKKRGRPSTVKTEPLLEKTEKIEKVEVVVETYVNNENFLKEKAKGRKGKVCRKVSKLLEDVEQLLDYQEQQGRLRNRTLLDLPEAIQLMQKYRKKKKSKKKRKTYIANVLDESAPLKVSLKRQRKAKRPQFTLQRLSSSGEKLLRFKLLRETVGAENVSKLSSPSEIKHAKSAASHNIKKQPFKSAKSPLQQTIPITNEDVSLMPKKRGRPPVSQLPSASKSPTSPLSKVIDDNIMKPKKRGRPSSVKTDDVPEPETGASSKPEAEVKTDDIVEDEPLAKQSKTDTQLPKPLSLVVAPDAKNDQDEALLSEEKQFPIKRRGRPPKKAIIAELEAEAAAAAAAAAAEEAKAEVTKFEKPSMSTSGTVSLAGSGTLAAGSGNEKAKERPQEVTQKLVVDNTSKPTSNEDSKQQPSNATPAKKRGRPKRVVTDEKIENLDSVLGSDSLVTVEKGDASPASKRKRGPVIEQKEVATIVAGLETGILPKDARITEERPKSEGAKLNDKVKSSKLLEIADKLSKSQAAASDDKKLKENVKVAKAIDEKSAEKNKVAKPIDEKPAEKIPVAKAIVERSAEKIKVDEKPAEKIKVAKAIDENPAEKIKVAKAIEQKSEEKIKVPKAIEQKPAEKIRAPKPIDEKSAEKIKLPKPTDEKPAERIKAAKVIDEKPAEKIKAAKVIDEKPAKEIKMAKVLPEKVPEKVKSPKLKPSEKVNLPKILLIPPKILEPKPTEKIKSPSLAIETKPADKNKVAKAIDKKTTEKIKVAKAIDKKPEEIIKVAKPIEQKPAEKIKIKIYDAKPLPEKVKSPKPEKEKVKSPKPEKEKVKSPKVMAQSTEINDNRYVVQSVAANPLKIKLKTGSFGSDLDMVKAPLKLKVSLKDCSSSGELSGGITKKKKHKKKKQRTRSPSSGHQDTSKPIILRIKSPTNKRPEEPTAAVVKVEKIKVTKAIDEKPSGSGGNNGYLVGIKKTDDKVSSINDISAAKKPVTPAGAGVAPVTPVGAIVSPGAERDTRAPSSASDHGAASMVTFSPESSPEHKVQTNFFMPSTSAKSFDSAEIGLGEGQFKDLMKAIDSDDESKPSVSTKAKATASSSPLKGSLSWLSEAKASTSAASAASSASVKQSQVDGTIDSWSRSSSISQSSPIHLSENEKDEKDEDSSDNLEKQSVIHKRMKQILDRPKTKGNLIKNIFFKVAKKRKIVVVRYRKPDQRMYDLDEYFDRKETERLDEPYDEDVDDPTMMKQPKTFKNSQKLPQPSSSSSSPMSFTHVRFSLGLRNFIKKKTCYKKADTGGITKIALIFFNFF